MDYTRDAILIHELNKTSFNIHHPPPHHHQDEFLPSIADEQLILVNNASLPDDITFNGTDNSSLDYVPYEQRIETYLVPVLFTIIFIIGFLGNGALIFIFIKHRTMRNVPNM